MLRSIRPTRAVGVTKLTCLDVQVRQADGSPAEGAVVSIESACDVPGPRYAPTWPTTTLTSAAISSKATSWAAASGSWRWRRWCSWIAAMQSFLAGIYAAKRSASRDSSAKRIRKS